MGYITSVGFTLERHFIDAGVDRVESFLEGRRVSGDHQNTSPRCENLVVGCDSAGMEDDDI
jgi:hypothetical protein